MRCPCLRRKILAQKFTAKVAEGVIAILRSFHCIETGCAKLTSPGQNTETEFSKSSLATALFCVTWELVIRHGFCFNLFQINVFISILVLGVC